MNSDSEMTIAPSPFRPQVDAETAAKLPSHAHTIAGRSLASGLASAKMRPDWKPGPAVKESVPTEAVSESVEPVLPPAAGDSTVPTPVVATDATAVTKDALNKTEIAESVVEARPEVAHTPSVDKKKSKAMKPTKAPAPQDLPTQETLEEAVVEPSGENKTGDESDIFSSLGLPAAVCDQLKELGYEQPTPIQAATIPHILDGRDVLGQAQTGTGKTAAFALPLLSGIAPQQRHPQVLVLCPTRELAMQVANSFETYAGRMKGIRVAAVYGGASYQPQIRALKSGAQIVVGTPGRVMDHMKQGTLNISQLGCLVLDEADEMLRMGFIEDVQYVLSHTPEQRQIALFSATMPPAIREIAERHLKDPEVIKIQSRQTTADTVDQRYMVVPHRQKFETLTRLLESEPTDGVIVFTRTKVTTVEVAEALGRRGLSAAALNGDIAQSLRERTVQQLKNRKLDVLVATDVAARGLDIDRVSHVINYDLPHDSEAYVHRIGRTGRAGRNGVAILLVTPKETRSLKYLQRQSGNKLTETALPSIDQLNQMRILRFQEQVNEAMKHRDVAVYSEMLKNWIEKEELDAHQVAAAMMAMMHSEQPLLLDDLPHARPKSSGRTRPADGGYQTFRVAVGKRDRVQAKNIVGAIANESGLSGDEIGKIRVMDNFSLVDLPAGMEEELVATLSETKVGGRPMRLRPDAAPGDRRRPSRDWNPGPNGSQGRRRGKPERGQGQGNYGQGGYGGRGDGGYSRGGQGQGGPGTGGRRKQRGRR